MFFVDQQKENPLLIYFWSLIVRAHHLRYFKTNQTHTHTHMRFNFSLSSFWSHQLRSNVRRFIEKVMAWQFLFDPRLYSRAFGVCVHVGRERLRRLCFATQRIRNGARSRCAQISPIFIFNLASIFCHYPISALGETLAFTMNPVKGFRCCCQI